MRVALVHDLLTRRGGAEQLLRVLSEMFPDAPIYTLLYDERRLGLWFPRERVHPSSLQKVPQLFTLHSALFTALLNHHLYLPWFPRAVASWNFSDFDLVISSSTAFAHGAMTRTWPNVKHLCYVHSPARYLWDQTHAVLERAGRGLLGPLRRWYLSHVFHSLRMWDVEMSDMPDTILANSRAVQRRIELYWRRESRVVYPPVELGNIHLNEQRGTSNEQRPYLILSTLTPYKRIDLAIEACNAMQRPLLIAGEGPDRRRMGKLAGPTVTFLGYVADEQKWQLYAKARALIFPGEDDFGIAPVEAQACGTPVVAYRGGGALETVVEGTTGEFFPNTTPESLVDALRKFEAKTYDPEACRRHAEQFSRERFEEGIRGAVEEVMTGGVATESTSTYAWHDLSNVGRGEPLGTEGGVKPRGGHATLRGPQRWSHTSQGKESP